MSLFFSVLLLLLFCVLTRESLRLFQSEKLLGNLGIKVRLVFVLSVVVLKVILVVAVRHVDHLVI